MSLAAIRELRLGRQKPAMVLIVIGERPDALADDAAAVIVRPNDEPAHWDWRPLIGVTVAVFTLAPRPDLTLTVFEQLQAAGARLVGAADQSGVYPLLTGPDEPHEALLRRAWSLLCR